MIDEKKAVDEGYLYDWYINSVLDTDEPVWTEKHIEELCNDFYVIPKDMPKVGEWIPVSEELPKDNDDELYDMVSVTLKNGSLANGVYRTHDEEWWTRPLEGDNVYSNEHEVIAWMPTPEPYKEDEHD